MPFAEQYQELYSLLLSLEREPELVDFIASVKDLQAELKADLHDDAKCFAPGTSKK